MKTKNKKILTYKDLKPIIAGENGEDLVILNQVCPKIVCRYKKQDMIKYTGENILIRKQLAVKLERISNRLEKIRPSVKLKVVYGYRHPQIQKKYFARLILKLKKTGQNISNDDLISLAHNFVAVPDVAGHTVGGAVDITIECNGLELDMGTEIADFSQPDKIKTFSKLINKKQTENRLFLLNLMIEQGFSPFFGEWWHFSYGDKEWACYYGKKRSLYSSINVRKK